LASINWRCSELIEQALTWPSAQSASAKSVLTAHSTIAYVLFALFGYYNAKLFVITVPGLEGCGY
jgi:hypothetical protein